MARPKSTKEVIADETITTETCPVVSEARTKYEAFIEAYKKQNPAKYELKKEALLSKLNTL